MRLIFTVFSRRLLVCLVLACALGAAVDVVLPATPVLAACPINKQPCPSAPGGCIDEKQLCILEPVPGGPTYLNPGGAPLEVFFGYINSGVWQWAFMAGVAIAVLNCVIGGLQIVMSNGDSNMVGKGKDRFIAATVGLIMLLLSGVILEFINPLGFTAV